MINDVDHHLIYLIVTCTSCLMKCLLKHSATFFFHGDVCLMWSFEGSLYVLDTGSLSDL